MGGSIRERVYILREWLIEQKRQLIVPFTILCLYGLSIGINMYRYTQGRFAMYPTFAGNVLLVAKCFVGIAEVSFGLLLVPVSRGLVTWLRSTWLRHVIDFDGALNFHAWLAGIGITAGTIHGICATVAYINIGRIPLDIQAAVGRAPKDVAGMLLSWNVLSGLAMFTLACLTFPFALKWPRQAPWLKNTKLGKILNNADYFWITHHILIIVWLPVAIMHSIKWTPGFPKTFAPAFQLETTKFAYYIAAPLIIYLFNRLQRIATASHLALVVDAGVVGGDVLALKLLKPRFFDHKPGQYLFLCCPKISPYEWHPFTITSSPQDKFVSVHIKRAGDWTGALHDLFKPAGRSYSVSGGGGSTCLGCSSIGNNSMQLLTAAVDSAVPPTSTRGVLLSGQQQQEGEQDNNNNNQQAFISGSANGIAVITNRRPRVSVDIAARFGEEATVNLARARRSSAPGFKSSDAPSGRVTRELSGTAGGAPIARALNRNANNLLAGAWDPRAERVIVEAEERLKQAVSEIADRRKARCSCPGSLEPAFAAFSDYRPTPADRPREDSAAGANGQIVVAKKSVGFSLEGAKDDEPVHVWVPPLLYIDGPFGAPTQDFEHYKVVVLVGTGIGITPMASVLRSLMHDLYDARCENCGTVNRRLCRMMQNKVYVHWVTRSLEGMAWFQDLLSSISNLDVDRVFQFNIHITKDTRSGARNHLAHGSQVMPEPLALLASKAGSTATGSTSLPGIKVDPLPVNYSYERPDMRKTLQEVQAAHSSEYVGVFFCGPRVMGQQVQRACRKLNAAANEMANKVAMDPEAPACPRPCRLCFHEEIF